MTSPWFRSSSASLLGRGQDELVLCSSLQSQQSIVFTNQLLDPDNKTFAGVVGQRDCLVVTTPTVDTIYGRQIKAYFTAQQSGFDNQYMVLPCTEATKTIETMRRVVDRAKAMHLARRSPIVAIGGGVCLDICGFAASVYRRGISHIKVPTTLLGLVDAGIGTKNGLNLGEAKSGIGTFYPPESSVLAPDFLASLEPKLLRGGIAEVLKLAIVCDRDLFELIEEHGAMLLESRFQSPSCTVDLIIRRSVTGMLQQLCTNLFEHDTYERLVDFGHTFSPAIESSSAYTVQHGEAVAIDMAISSLLSRNLSFLAPEDAARIIRSIKSVGLPIYPTAIDASALWDSLITITAHRNGRLCLPVPTGIGSCTFLPTRNAIGNVSSLQSVLNELRAAA